MANPESQKRLEAIAAQFTERAPIYEGSAAWMTDPGLIQAMVDTLKMGPESEMLEVCCGTGLVGAAFKSKVARVVGLDLTPSMLEIAKDRLDEVIQGTADRLPFAGAAFDVVVMRQALHFLESIPDAMEQMYQAVCPDGQIIVAHRIPHGAADAAWWAQVNREKQPLIKNLLTEEDIHFFLEDVGFKEITLQNYYLTEIIQRWTDTPEARANSDRIFELYRSAPPDVVSLRPIEFLEDGTIRDRWRWGIFSAFKY